MRVQAVIAATLALSACKRKHADHKQPEQTAQGSATRAVPTESVIHPPEVHGPGVEPVKVLSTKLTYGGGSLSVGGARICDVAADGGIEDACYERTIRALEGVVKSDDPIGFELPASMAYQRVGTMLSKLEGAGFHSFALLVGDGKTMIPIATPDPKEQSGLRLVVTVNTGSVVLWSLSGQEGNRRRPKLQQPIAGGLAPLTNALAEIVHRRWPSGNRAPEDKEILLEMDRAQTVEGLLGVIAAVRASDKGELFPTIILAGGI